MGLASRADLLGKRGWVKFFHASSSRYAVCIDVSGEMVKVLEHYVFRRVARGAVDYVSAM